MPERVRHPVFARLYDRLSRSEEEKTDARENTAMSCSPASRAE